MVVNLILGSIIRFMLGLFFEEVGGNVVVFFKISKEDVFFDFFEFIILWVDGCLELISWMS